MQDKKSFLLYFDSYPMLEKLSPEEVGYLMRAVYEYAMRVWQEDIRVEVFLESRSELSPAASMACGFLCANVRRDTEKWRQRRERYSSAAKEKKERGGEAHPTEEQSGKDAWLYVNQNCL